MLYFCSLPVAPPVTVLALAEYVFRAHIFASKVEQVRRINMLTEVVLHGIAWHGGSWKLTCLVLHSTGIGRPKTLPTLSRDFSRAT